MGVLNFTFIVLCSVAVFKARFLYIFAALLN
jgi:hypothetical protein